MDYLRAEDIDFLKSVSQDKQEKALDYIRSGDVAVDIANPKTGLQPLHFAAKNGNVEVGLELLNKGAEVNAKTVRGNTALHVAALSGQPDFVKLLLKSGAEVNAQSQDCGDTFTPLYMAAQIGHQEIVTLLLAQGADPLFATQNGCLPKDVAHQQGYTMVSAILEEYELRTSSGFIDNAEQANANANGQSEPLEGAVGGITIQPPSPPLGAKLGARPRGPPPKFTEAIAPSPGHSRSSSPIPNKIAMESKS